LACCASSHRRKSCKPPPTRSTKAQTLAKTSIATRSISLPPTVSTSKAWICGQLIVSAAARGGEDNGRAHCLPEWCESSIEAPTRKRGNGAEHGLAVLRHYPRKRKRGCFPKA